MEGNGSRLARLTVGAILPGLGLAVASLMLLIALGFATPVLPLALVLPAHGLFVVLLTRYLLREPLRLGWRQWGTALFLTAVMVAAIWLDDLGTNAMCGDGRIYAPSTLPQLPWAWIGWALLVVTALPSRLLGYPAARLLHWSDRVILAAPFAAAVFVTGLPFQRAIGDCEIVERWGLFEGGLFLIPLLALFLFTLSFSIAVLSAAFVRPETPETAA
jgi:hypothetical protein